ncbi:MAG: bifunctional phosphoribosyl-AMP cyclohydrolase/phosphoribosyl-ATP diphosphatase HisIE [SAR202 cluster bacterium]|nr:bifunctional phosphoribosyl-AMP cyclohydrolase/phosphoribosyl-ATP diphosphatase HisIE [SAR202 cluster bacterium]|tara:strand:+ start:56834 stop:57469 length:636 start_codon:yes stop_codon:yes gene_type:complete
MDNVEGAKILLDQQGLVLAICQDDQTDEILMVAYMNPDSLAKTIETREMYFYSRSRQEIWHKGETSGSFLHVSGMEIDCDGDALLFRVKPDGPACHTGKKSCFFTEIAEPVVFSHHQQGPGIIDELFQTIQSRKQSMPAKSYTTQLFEQGTARIAQKVAEEGSEVALAAATKDIDNLPNEAADLVYHLLVLLADANLSPEDVWSVLRNRRS